jgi:hypothetical protein
VDPQKAYVLRTVEERGVRLIRLWFTDVVGQMKSFAISPAELESAFEEGMQFDGSAIDGFSRIQESDVLAKPDPTTFELLPWADQGTTARMFCDIFNPTGSPFDGDPRHVLRRNLDEALQTGYSFFVAPEMEFFYFADGEPSHPPTLLDSGSYFDLTTSDVASDLRRETISVLETMGIPVEYSFHEDSPSQHEIDLRYTDELTKLTDEILKPNGLCFSPDYRYVYIADTAPTHHPNEKAKIIRWDVLDNGLRLANRREFAVLDAGFHDGIRADVDGNVWCGTGFGGEGIDGVHVYAPDGTKLGQIVMPEGTANLCFVGKHRNRLFMTSSQSVYTLYTGAQGAHLT